MNKDPVQAEWEKHIRPQLKEIFGHEDAYTHNQYTLGLIKHLQYRDSQREWAKQKVFDLYHKGRLEGALCAEILDMDYPEFINQSKKYANDTIQS